MAYTCVGLIYLCIFGVQIFYNEVYSAEMSEPEGYPVINNGSHLLPLVRIFYFKNRFNY